MSSVALAGPQIWTSQPGVRSGRKKAETDKVVEVQVAEEHVDARWYRAQRSAESSDPRAGVQYYKRAVRSRDRKARGVAAVSEASPGLARQSSRGFPRS